jgi:hypothetical protein
LTISATSTPNPTPNLTYRYLDAGANLTMQGPGGSRVLTKSTTGGAILYGVTVTGGLAAGSYTVTGPGGPDVAAFSITGTLGPELLWTNAAAVATTTRSAGMPITWTGGDPTQLVMISGQSVDPNAGTGVLFQCYANQPRLSFTVPASVLNQLPASTSIQGFSIPGNVQVSTNSSFVRATVANLDFLGIETTTSISNPVTFK